MFALCSLNSQYDIAWMKHSIKFCLYKFCQLLDQGCLYGLNMLHITRIATLLSQPSTLCTCMHVHLHTCKLTHANTHTHAHTHKHTHICKLLTHTCFLFGSSTSIWSRNQAAPPPKLSWRIFNFFNFPNSIALMVKTSS